MAKKKAPAGVGAGVKRRGRPPVEGITEPQRRTLAAIRAHIARRGFPPTVQELGELLGIAPASAHEQVNQLVRKGYLRRDTGKARSLEVLKEPKRAKTRPRASHGTRG